MIDDLFAYNCGFPDEAVALGAECEQEIQRIKASLPAPAISIGPKSSFELAAQRDDFRRRLEAERLHEIACAVDPRYRKRAEEKRAAVAERQATEQRVLEKSESRRRSSIRNWVAQQLAMKKTAEELIAHAEGRDQETANLIREVCAELETA